VDGSNAAQDIWPRADTRSADHAAFPLPVTRLVELLKYFGAGNPIATGSHGPENAFPYGKRISSHYSKSLQSIVSHLK
jgi:hypothetical protein